MENLVNLNAQVVGTSWYSLGKHGPKYCVVAQAALQVFHTTLQPHAVWHGWLALTLGQWQHFCQLWCVLSAVDCHLADANLIGGLAGQSSP